MDEEERRSLHGKLKFILKRMKVLTDISSYAFESLEGDEEVITLFIKDDILESLPCTTRDKFFINTKTRKGVELVKLSHLKYFSGTPIHNMKKG